MVLKSISAFILFIYYFFSVHADEVCKSSQQWELINFTITKGKKAKRQDFEVPVKIRSHRKSIMKNPNLHLYVYEIKKNKFHIIDYLGNIRKKNTSYIIYSQDFNKLRHRKYAFLISDEYNLSEINEAQRETNNEIPLDYFSNDFKNTSTTAFPVGIDDLRNTERGLCNCTGFWGGTKCCSGNCNATLGSCSGTCEENDKCWEHTSCSCRTP